MEVSTTTATGNDGMMSHRERIVARQAHAKWVQAGRPPGAWKTYWYEAWMEVEEYLPGNDGGPAGGLA
jgi:hypothetical protein